MNTLTLLPLLLGNVRGWELIIILVVILLLFGGKKIPQLMHGIGKGVRSFKDGMNGIEKEIRDDNDNNTSKEKEKENK